ncbi:MAG TPA: saccharopine dehydrogenase NADP-binding domain-containing protein [Kofleriaceae bacterium]|nr:saccharopine dehydrogenase NADP-binding domain-containing protein [Kofleriaceae bacterium]
MTRPGIVVFGAAGHTGRFVVAELDRRGWTPVLAGRDVARLRALREAYPASEVRVASVDDAAGLDAVLRGARAVINCAGPFLDTAAPIIEAALRARAHYLDVTAEQAAALAAFERFAADAMAAGVAVVPAMAFYGGLADLLATAAMRGLDAADDIRVAIALDSWKPTRGTRLTGQRNTVPRVVVSDGRLQPLAGAGAAPVWRFPAPFGVQQMASVPLSEIITISRHLRSREIHTYLNVGALDDLRDPSTAAPVAADASGRSAQTFAMEVVVRAGGQERRAIARGRDIYAVTAPLVVEAAERILDGRSRRAGAAAAGELFDASDFLSALTPQHLDTGLP